MKFSSGAFAVHINAFFKAGWWHCGRQRSLYALVVSLVVLLITPSLFGQSTNTWTGGSGTGGNWNDSANWGGSSISVQSILNFTNSTRLNNTNNFTADSVGYQIYFKGGAGTGAFNLYGNSILFYDFSGTAPNIQNEGTTSQTVTFPFKHGNTNAGTVFKINGNSGTGGPIIFNGDISGANGTGTSGLALTAPALSPLTASSAMAPQRCCCNKWAPPIPPYWLPTIPIPAARLSAMAPFNWMRAARWVRGT
jgi:hypothetical protein